MDGHWPPWIEGDAHPGTDVTPEQERRLAAKRSNERVKLAATSLNAIALAVLGTAFVIPAINNPLSLLSPGPWLLF